MEADFEYLNNVSDERLGLEGYCKVFCEVLLQYLPNAEVWAFPNPDYDSCEHVFLKQDEKCIDSKGVRSIDLIKADPDLKLRGQPKRITLEQMRACSMISDEDTDESAEATARIRRHILANRSRYGIGHL
ncbi:MAG: hypothetical protein ACLPT4_05085 [Verrucomicrobiia bacterium]